MLTEELAQAYIEERQREAAEFRRQSQTPKRQRRGATPRSGLSEVRVGHPAGLFEAIRALGPRSII